MKFARRRNDQAGADLGRRPYQILPKLIRLVWSQKSSHLKDVVTQDDQHHNLSAIRPAKLASGESGLTNFLEFHLRLGLCGHRADSIAVC